MGFDEALVRRRESFHQPRQLPEREKIVDANGVLWRIVLEWPSSGKVYSATVWNNAGATSEALSRTLCKMEAPRPTHRKHA